MERQEIYKQLDDLIEKARSGVYSNTYENRKKGRVGQKYGSKKSGEEKSGDNNKLGDVPWNSISFNSLKEGGYGLTFNTKNDKKSIKVDGKDVEKLMSGTREERQKIQKEYFNKIKEDKKDGGKEELSSHKSGDTIEHNGKKYKKQANGKWLEVSEQGMTSDEHRNKSREINREIDRLSSYGSGFSTFGFREMDEKQKVADAHKTASSKLSDKEYTDEEVGLGKKKEVKKESGSKETKKVVGGEKGESLKAGDKINYRWTDRWGNHHMIQGVTLTKVTSKMGYWNSPMGEEKGKLSDMELVEQKKRKELEEDDKKRKSLFNNVRDWVGDEYTDDQIDSIYSQLEEQLSERDYRVRVEGSQEKFNDNVSKKVDELRRELRPGMEQKDLEDSDIKDILWGIVMSKNLNKSLEPDIIKALGIEVEPDYTPLEQTLIKGFEAGIYDEDYLQKAMGSHKYFKREPKAGGGYKYYYTEAQYKKEKGKDEGEKKDKVFKIEGKIKNIKRQLANTKTYTNRGFETAKKLREELRGLESELKKEKKEREEE